jgi:hypothetical protein
MTFGHPVTVLNKVSFKKALFLIFSLLIERSRPETMPLGSLSRYALGISLRLSEHFVAHMSISLRFIPRI